MSKNKWLAVMAGSAILAGSLYAVADRSPKMPYDDETLEASYTLTQEMTPEQWEGLGEAYFIKARSANSVHRSISDGLMAVYCTLRSE